MITKCEFFSCSWLGRLRDLVKHCDTVHTDFVREIDDTNCIEFSFDEIVTNDFLLLGKHGLYWFLHGQGQDCVRRGVFAVAGSNICTYTVKLGELPVYLGPYKISKTVRRRYDVKITSLQVQLIEKLLQSSSVKLCFVQDESNSSGTHI